MQQLHSNMYFYYYYYFDDSNNLTSQACQCYWLIGLVLVILELGTCSIKNDRLSSRIVMDCEVVNHNRSISYISKAVGTAISPLYICGGFKILQLICICKFFFYLLQNNIIPTPSGKKIIVKVHSLTPTIHPDMAKTTWWETMKVWRKQSQLSPTEDMFHFFYKSFFFVKSKETI